MEAIADDVSSAQADFRKVEYAFGRRGEAMTEYIDRQLDPGLEGGVRTFLNASPAMRTVDCHPLTDSFRPAL